MFKGVISGPTVIANAGDIYIIGEDHAVNGNPDTGTYFWDCVIGYANAHKETKITIAVECSNSQIYMDGMAILQGGARPTSPINALTYYVVANLLPNNIHAAAIDMRSTSPYNMFQLLYQPAIYAQNHAAEFTDFDKYRQLIADAKLFEKHAFYKLKSRRQMSMFVKDMLLPGRSLPLWYVKYYEKITRQPIVDPIRAQLAAIKEGDSTYYNRIVGYINHFNYNTLEQDDNLFSAAIGAAENLRKSASMNLVGQKYEQLGIILIIIHSVILDVNAMISYWQWKTANKSGCLIILTGHTHAQTLSQFFDLPNSQYSMSLTGNIDMDIATPTVINEPVFANPIKELINQFVNITRGVPKKLNALSGSPVI